MKPGDPVIDGSGTRGVIREIVVHACEGPGYPQRVEVYVNWEVGNVGTDPRTM